MDKVIDIVVMTASNYTSERTLQERFLNKLQDVIDKGGNIVSIVRDDSRYKKAYIVR